MSSKYGAGIGLTRSFDFDIDQSGDIASFAEGRELRKDLSFQLARVLDGRPGGPFSEQELSKIERSVAVSLEADRRVDEVTFVDASRSAPNTLRILVELVAQDTPQEFVFEV